MRRLISMLDNDIFILKIIVVKLKVKVPAQINTTGILQCTFYGDITVEHGLSDNTAQPTSLVPFVSP